MIILDRLPAHTLMSKTEKLIEFFNNLEKQLEYPNCEGKADKERILKKAEQDLIMLGIV